MKRNRVIYLTIALIIGLTLSCNSFKTNQEARVAVAQAGEQILYYDQIPGLILPGMSRADSIAVVQNYINKWAKREILKLKAIENLTPDFRDEVEKQLDEIRTNLLIHRYQQQIINQKMDTLIAEEEIENHYLSKASTFVLNTNIVKALFIKMPSDVPNIEKVTSLYRSSDPVSLAQLELFCYQFADKFDDFDEEWVPLVNILAELPVTIDNQEDFLRRNSFFETSDSLFTYFVMIRDYKLRSTTAPYDYARNNIRSIILNTRKMEFIQDIENGVFNEALRNNLYKLYQ